MKTLFGYTDEMEKQLNEYEEMLKNANKVEDLPENLKNFLSDKSDMTIAELVGAVLLDSFGVPMEIWSSNCSELNINSINTEEVMKTLKNGIIEFERK